MRANVGKRVRFIFSTNPEKTLESGDTGTVWHIIAPSGVLRVKWDNGSKADLDPEKDKWEILEES